MRQKRPVEKIAASRPAYWQSQWDFRIRQYAIGSEFAERLRKTAPSSLGFVNQLCRQLDDKSGPAEGRFVVGSNDPIVCFNDRPGDRQAQAHAGFFGRKEAVEQTRQMLRVDAGAAVFDDAAYRLRIDFTSFEATRQRHIGSSPHPDRYDPDTWTDEYAFLTRPGQADIQTTLFLDYRTNVASYPRWQSWLRKVQPPTLVVWGKYDPSFAVAGATA